MPARTLRLPSNNDTVSNNTISGNYGSCGIVYATHNSGGSITGGVITGNTITGHIGVFKSTGPDLGGIVVAAASAGATVSNTTGERQQHQRLVRGRHHRARPRSQ